MKIAINKCYGGFGVSEKCAIKLREKGVKIAVPGEKYSDGTICEKFYGNIDNEEFGIEDDDYHKYRTDKRLIETIEEMGCKEASSDLAQIRIVDVPDNIKWFIDDYDGIESVHEEHNSW